MPRDTLPNRRAGYVFTLDYGNKFEVGISLFHDGRPAEVFISGGKVGTQVEALARDCAVLISLALQHGCPIATIQKALTREEGNSPSSVAGALVDAVSAEVSTLGNR